MFNEFKKAVQKKFGELSLIGLYRVEVDKDLLWSTYLGSFPPGSDPIFRERSEHDCQCCRQFIRAVGDAVSIIDGKIVSIWNVGNELPSPYEEVAQAMAELVESRPIANTFLYEFGTAGTDKNFQQLEGGEVLTFEHFYTAIPTQYQCRRDMGTKLSNTRANYDVLKRGLEEFTVDDMQTVLDLIDQNSLYRGAENRPAVATFLGLKDGFDKAEDKSLFCWLVSRSLPESICKFRNTAIGKLLIDLSEGKELDAAVKSFEAMVAPANYQRPTALVTKAMVEKAKQDITDLGLTSALERRYAVLEDISINDILFADRSARTRISGDIFDDVAAGSGFNMKSLDKVEEVSIDTFINDILPRVDSVEVLFENKHAANMVSLIAPADAESENLFKWPNKFSWSYAGDVTDSIKERVKQAGGAVTGDLMCRLAWDNKDDLDLHMKESRYEIYFRNKRKLSPCGGVLDLDANGSDGMRDNPAENIVYADMKKMRVGDYTLYVHQYQQRQATNVGFTVEIEALGVVHTFVYDKVVQQDRKVDIATITKTAAGELIVKGLLPSTSVSKKVWGLDTQNFHRVNVIMNSPNHWDGHAVGNKHYFFMLDGCTNEEKARGFYNEFLNAELSKHRKVLEVVGSKMRTDESADQLSGLGFSSTQRNSLVCRVKGSFTRVLKVTF